MRTGVVDRDIWNITVWYNPKEKKYYYRLLTSICFDKPGFRNRYGHELILLIPVYKDLIKQHNTSFFIKILRKVISLLTRLDNKLTK